MTAADTVSVSVVVLGVPVGQGRVTTYGPGRTAHSNAAALLPWRSSIAAHTQQAMDAAGITSPLEGPVAVQVTFRLPRPRTAPRLRRLPVVRPDLDHLLRAVGDALSGVLLVDDGQIVDVRCYKRYADAAFPPGVRFTVSTDLGESAP